MKKTVSKSAISINKNNKSFEQKHLSTGINSHQRSHKISQQDKEIKISKNIDHEKTNRSLQTNPQSKHLCMVIQKFYTSLCDLPLQKLINSSSPNQWIREQHQTLNRLTFKLDKFHKSKNHEYYRWKLKSIEQILANIKQNLQTLILINNSKNYFSGSQNSDFNSRQSSTLSHEFFKKEATLKNFNCKQQKMKQMLSYDHYIIENKMQSSSEINDITKRQTGLNAKTVNSEDQDFDVLSNHFARSEIMGKKSTIQKSFYREKQNRNQQNMDKQIENMRKNNYSNVDIDSKDKTLTKINKTLNNNSQKTNANAQNKFLQDRVMRINQQETKRSQNLQYSNASLTSSFENKPEKLMNDQKQRQFISIIKQLKLQLLAKDKQIQKLLINEQQFDQSFQVLGQRQKQKVQQILFLKESLAIMSKEKQKMQKQINQVKSQNQDLKQTIRIERQRVLKEQRLTQKIKRKYEQLFDQKQQIQSQMNRMKDENRQLKKKDRIMAQKQQIYTKKYFKLYNKLQDLRQNEEKIMKQFKKYGLEEKQKSKLNSAYEEIKQIIENHKTRIYQQSSLL